MLERTAKVRLRKLVQSARRREAGLSSYARIFDDLVLSRQEGEQTDKKRGRKPPRERRRLAPEQLQFIHAIADGKEAVDDEQSVQDRLEKMGLTMHRVRHPYDPQSQRYRKYGKPF